MTTTTTTYYKATEMTGMFKGLYKIETDRTAIYRDFGTLPKDDFRSQYIGSIEEAETIAAEAQATLADRLAIAKAEKADRDAKPAPAPKPAKSDFRVDRRIRTFYGGYADELDRRANCHFCGLPTRNGYCAECI